MKISPPPSEPSFLRLSAGASQNESRENAEPTPFRDLPPRASQPVSSFLRMVWIRNHKTRIFIRFGFGVGLVLVAFVSFLAYRNTAQLVSVEAQVSDSYALRDQIHVVRTAQRRTFFSFQKYLASAKNDDYAVFQNNVNLTRIEADRLRTRAKEAGSTYQTDADRIYFFANRETGFLQQAAETVRRRGTGQGGPFQTLPKEVTAALGQSVNANEASNPLLARMDEREGEASRAQKQRARQICDQTLQITSFGGAITLLVVLLAFLTVERDLTRRTRTEAALREREAETGQLLHQLGESEDRFRTVADTAPVMLYITDETGAATYLSRSWLEFRGRTAEEELGFGWADAITEREVQAMMDAARAKSMDRVPNRMEFRARRHDGALRWLLSSSVPRYVDGHYVGRIGSSVDITEVKQAEAEMRLLVERQQKSETRLRQVSRQANCLLWEAQVSIKTADPATLGEWTPTWISCENHTYLSWELSVLDEAEAFRWLPIVCQPNQTFSNAFDAARYSADRASLNQRSSAAILEGKPGYRNEFRVRLADGSDRWLTEDVHIEPQHRGVSSEFLEAGHWHLVGICTDITDRKRQEEQMTRLTTELQRSNEALQDFASIASHDLREPLRKIQMFGGMLHKNIAQSGDSAAERNLERVLAAATRMDSLVRDLLAYSRVTSKAAPPALVDLAQVANEVVVDLEAQILETGGVVGCDGLPKLRADALQMRQILQNLISNALKFHKPGEPPVVLVQGKREVVDGVLYVVVSVSDNGVGFEQEYAERIFNIFERLDSAREGYAGTGVGLAICRKIVQRHGGTITAQSRPGYGSAFTVRLPVP